MNKLSQEAWVYLLAILKFLLPFILVHPDWELHRDEFLYYQQGQHLAAGYLENPPLIGLMSYLSSLTGGSEFSIKFWPALIGAITLLVTTKLCSELGGGGFAKLLAALGIFFSAFLRIHYLFQPNMLDVLSWLLAAYFLVRYINRGRNADMYYMCITLALGCWGKYSVLFFIAAMAISIMLTPQRTMLLKKHFWLAVLTAFLVLLPNIIWQYRHNWPLLHHMEELRETQLRFLSKANFIKEQLLLLLPVLPVWMAGLYWLLRNGRYRVIGFIYLFVILLLLMSSGKGYYALGAYPMLLAAGGVCIEGLVRKPWLRYSFTLLILAASLPLIPVLLPMQSPGAMPEFNRRYGLKEMGLLRWEDLQDHPLQQDFADMQGWKEMAQRAETVFQHLPAAIKDSTVVYCRNYGQAGALKYYAKTEAFRERVFCDNGTFLLWIPDDLRFRHLVFVGEDNPAADDEVFNHFAERLQVDSVRNPLSRSFGTRIILFRNADGQAAPLANKGLAEMKQRFNR